MKLNNGGYIPLAEREMKHRIREATRRRRMPAFKVILYLLAQIDELFSSLSPLYT